MYNFQERGKTNIVGLILQMCLHCHSEKFHCGPLQGQHLELVPMPAPVQLSIHINLQMTLPGILAKNYMV